MYLTLKLVSSIINYKNNTIFSQNINLPIFTYINKSHPISLNKWEDLNYFTTFFPTLFLFGFKDHLTLSNRPKKIKILLEI